MGGEDDAVGAGHPLQQHGDQIGGFGGRGIAHGVGDVDRGGAGLDGDLHHAAQVVMLGPRRIHRRPLHIVAQVAGMGHGVVDALGHLVHVQVGDGAVQRRGADEGVDARAAGMFHRLPAAVDVLEIRPGQAADRGVLRPFRNLADGGEIAVEAMGKPASMMSTPISSRSWAISSFSSWVMVAPGDCSPSRSVVSKMTTRGCWSVCAMGNVLDVLAVLVRFGRCSPPSGRAHGHAQRRLRRRRPRGSTRAICPAWLAAMICGPLLMDFRYTMRGGDEKCFLARPAPSPWPAGWPHGLLLCKISWGVRGVSPPAGRPKG
jgi:hypothetical protein